MKFCEKCGRELSGEKFCPGCGKEIIFENKTNEITETNENTNKNGIHKKLHSNTVLEILKLPKKHLFAGGIVVIGILIIAVVLFSNNGPNFKKIYKQHCDSIWADVGDDGSYLSIDTNPYDEEDNGIAYHEAYTAIENINRELGLPESLFEDMGRTSGNDGKQSEEFDKVIVSWKYHPDTGMEVIYRKK